MIYWGIWFEKKQKEGSGKPIFSLVQVWWFWGTKLLTRKSRCVGKSY